MSGAARAAGALAAAAALGLAGTLPAAVAATTTGKLEPSPTRLWAEYPLDPTGGRQSRPAAQVLSATHESGTRAPVAASSGSDGGKLAIVLAGMALAFGTLLLVRVRAHEARTFASTAAGAAIRGTARKPKEAPNLLEALAPSAPSPHEALRRGASSSETRSFAPAARGVRGPLRLGPEREQPIDKAFDICRISWWRGYVKSEFYAEAVGPNRPPSIVAHSRMFRWRRAEPPPASGDALDAHNDLVDRLVAAGWTPESRGGEWYEYAFLRRG
jgi:hypothetical protein